MAADPSTEIVDALCDEFEVAREVCEPDTVAFVSALVRPGNSDVGA